MDQKRIVTSVVFKFIERLAVKGLGLVISIVMARLLAPEVFGLVAIINVFANLAQVFVQSGLGTALVQNRSTEEDDYSTVFYLSMAIAVLMILILWVSAPVVAAYYENNLLIWPLRVYAFSLLFGALNSVQNAKLQREMKFRTMMLCNLIATVISGAVGVTAAFLGAGLWALIIYNFSNTAIVSVCMMVIQKWRPRPVFSISRAKELFGFGWKMLVSGLLCSLYYDIRALIIGKKYSTADLAYYTKGQLYPDLVEKTVNESIQSVMLPVLSSMQDDKEQMNRAVMKTIAVAMFGVVPAMLGLASVSDTLIPLLLTDKWLASIPLLCIFCIGNILGPIQSTNLRLLMATGRSDLYMRVEMIRRVVMIATLLVTVFVFDSVLAIAIGYAAGYWLDAWIIAMYVKRLTGLGFLKQLSVTWKSFAAGIVMVVAVRCIALVPCIAVLKLLLEIGVGAAVYIGVSALLRSEPLLEGKRLLLKVVKKKEK